MTPDVSMCHTQQFCGWDIVYKRLGPPGIIHVVWDLQKPHWLGLAYSPHTHMGSVGTTHKNCCRNTRTSYRPNIHTDHVQSSQAIYTACPTPISRPILNWQRRAARLYWVMDSLGWRASNLEQAFFLPTSLDFVSPMMDGSGYGIAWVSVILTSALLNMTNGTAAVWWVGVKCTVGMDLLCWIAHSMSKVTWAKWFSLRSYPTFNEMSWQLNKTTAFLSQHASLKTFLDQMQSVHCPGQQTNPLEHRHRTSLIAR